MPELIIEVATERDVAFDLELVTDPPRVPLGERVKRVLRNPWTLLVVKGVWDWARERWLSARDSRRRGLVL